MPPCHQPNRALGLEITKNQDLSILQYFCMSSRIIASFLRAAEAHPLHYAWCSVTKSCTILLPFLFSKTFGYLPKFRCLLTVFGASADLVHWFRSSSTISQLVLPLYRLCTVHPLSDVQLEYDLLITQYPLPPWFVTICSHFYEPRNAPSLIK
ncbi:hypothetical protein DAI22_02g153001 [Oryza sativa Japonica Group]|nr:hypothetical protein DAI22_02g153001 [Oryza sativa Japonica Group]